MWVRSEYANELAVLSAWLALLLPWNVSRVTRTDELSQGGGLVNTEVDSSIFFLRFPFAEVQLRNPGRVSGGDVNEGNVSFTVEPKDASETLDAIYAGIQVVGDLHVTTPPTSMAFYDGTLWQSSLLWAAAALAFVLAVALSIALYTREDAVVDRLPVSPVRLMGLLLGLYALGAAGASYLQYTERDLLGLPIPAGLLVVAVLAVVLLRTKAVARSEGTAD